MTNWYLTNMRYAGKTSYCTELILHRDFQNTCICYAHRLLKITLYRASDRGKARKEERQFKLEGLKVDFEYFNSDVRLEI